MTTYSPPVARLPQRHRPRHLEATVVDHDQTNYIHRQEFLDYDLDVQLQVSIKLVVHLCVFFEPDWFPTHANN